MASPEEIAAVLAALARTGADRPVERSRLQSWRDTRVAALRRSAERG